MFVCLEHISITVRWYRLFNKSHGIRNSQLPQKKYCKDYYSDSVPNRCYVARTF